MVDTEGLILQALVHAADVRDGTGGQWVLEALDPVQTRFPRLQHLWVDAAYRGQFVDWVKDTLGWSVEVVKHWWTGVSKVWVAPGQEPPEKPTGFHVLPRRWVVERTHAQCLRSALDVQSSASHDRTYWAAEIA